MNNSRRNFFKQFGSMAVTAVAVGAGVISLKPKSKPLHWWDQKGANRGPLKMEELQKIINKHYVPTLYDNIFKHNNLLVEKFKKIRG